MSTKHIKLKHPNWREAHQLAIYKHDRGVELGSVDRETTPVSFVVRVGLKPANSGVLTNRSHYLPSCFRQRYGNTFEDFGELETTLGC